METVMLVIDVLINSYVMLLGTLVFVGGAVAAVIGWWQGRREEKP